MFKEITVVIVGLWVRALDFQMEVPGSIPLRGPSCLLTNNIVKLSIALLYRFQRGNISVGVLVICDAWLD